jgi:hypothetical protein
MGVEYWLIIAIFPSHSIGWAQPRIMQGEKGEKVKRGEFNPIDVSLTLVGAYPGQFSVAIPRPCSVFCDESFQYSVVVHLWGRGGFSGSSLRRDFMIML